MEVASMIELLRPVFDSRRRQDLPDGQAVTAFITLEGVEVAANGSVVPRLSVDVMAPEHAQEDAAILVDEVWVPELLEAASGALKPHALGPCETADVELRW